jgi:hypothetical protein
MAMSDSTAVMAGKGGDVYISPGPHLMILSSVPSRVREMQAAKAWHMAARARRYVS